MKVIILIKLLNHPTKAYCSISINGIYICKAILDDFFTIVIDLIKLIKKKTASIVTNRKMKFIGKNKIIRIINAFGIACKHIFLNFSL